MLTLYLIRHAKSSWDNLTIDDFDRPLNNRGKRNAPFMAKQLFLRKEFPELLVSSTAKRAMTTAKYFAEEFKINKEEIVRVDELYHATVATWLKIVNQLPIEIKTIMMFGHNNGITQFANYLTNQEILNIPTCGIVKIIFELENWNMVSRGNGEMVYFDYPKKYENNNEMNQF